MDENKTKKELLKENLYLFIVGMIIGAVCLALRIFCEGDWTDIVLIVGIIFIIVAFYMLISGIIRVNRTYCKKCSARYGDCVYHEENLRHRGNKMYSTVVFKCICFRCGHEQITRKTFLHATYDESTGACHENDIEAWAKKLFWLE